jgi:hypothetical protein
MLSIQFGSKEVSHTPSWRRAQNPEPALSWHSGFRGGAHARHKTASFHHALRRRGDGLADRGARAATGDASLEMESSARINGSPSEGHGATFKKKLRHAPYASLVRQFGWGSNR